MSIGVVNNKCSGALARVTRSSGDCTASDVLRGSSRLCSVVHDATTNIPLTWVTDTPSFWKRVLMRKIILQVCAISLDGVIQTDGTDFERYFEQIPVDARSEAWIAEAVVGADALVVGRNTYLGMADYFPAAESGPMVDALNRVAKVVLSN